MECCIPWSLAANSARFAYCLCIITLMMLYDSLSLNLTWFMNLGMEKHNIRCKANIFLLFILCYAIMWQDCITSMTNSLSRNLLRSTSLLNLCIIVTPAQESCNLGYTTEIRFYGCPSIHLVFCYLSLVNCYDWFYQWNISWFLGLTNHTLYTDPAILL